MIERMGKMNIDDNMDNVSKIITIELYLIIYYFSSNVIQSKQCLNFKMHSIRKC